MSITAGLHDPLTPPRIGFLGPEGTFTEQAVLREADLAAAEHVPFPLMTEVLFAVADGRVELGVVPVENAIEGTVNATVDTMAFDVDVSIQRELVQQVSFELLAVPGATIEGHRTRRVDPGGDRPVPDLAARRAAGRDVHRCGVDRRGRRDGRRVRRPERRRHRQRPRR